MPEEFLYAWASSSAFDLPLQPAPYSGPLFLIPWCWADEQGCVAFSVFCWSAMWQPNSVLALQSVLSQCFLPLSQGQETSDVNVGSLFWHFCPFSFCLSCEAHSKVLVSECELLLGWRPGCPRLPVPVHYGLCSLFTSWYGGASPFLVLTRTQFFRPLSPWEGWLLFGYQVNFIACDPAL